MDTANPYPDIDVERRRDMRRVFRRRAVWAPTGIAPMRARTVDLSASGLALVSTLNPAIGAHCRVRFNLPARDGQVLDIDITARVARSTYSATEDGFRVGLEFESPDPDTRRALKRYVGG